MSEREKRLIQYALHFLACNLTGCEAGDLADELGGFDYNEFTGEYDLDSVVDQLTPELHALAEIL